MGIGVSVFIVLGYILELLVAEATIECLQRVGDLNTASRFFSYCFLYEMHISGPQELEPELPLESVAVLRFLCVGARSPSPAAGKLLSQSCERLG